ncbi:hypothetical protein BU26DRAFT_213110 [Trematosphaeria pertusa]|uniref:Uncharacterized protein n=1 Tax=Trematosphaeria pertusa TaxID=390896 RepID=A0A6A6IR50_9PLEO|nr:uncharacterized protein BU26DRAFT_213110 [Trematosphaeria pertusa]KAF2253014.1 hypothetical protein BU26DRAFT_213110 [Trematosphaeria pertusa]
MLPAATVPRARSSCNRCLRRRAQSARLPMARRRRAASTSAAGHLSARGLSSRIGHGAQREAAGRQAVSNADDSSLSLVVVHSPPFLRVHEPLLPRARLRFAHAHAHIPVPLDTLLPSFPLSVTSLRPSFPRTHPSIHLESSPDYTFVHQLESFLLPSKPSILFCRPHLYYYLFSPLLVCRAGTSWPNAQLPQLSPRLKCLRVDVSLGVPYRSLRHCVPTLRQWAASSTLHNAFVARLLSFCFHYLVLFTFPVAVSL